MYGEGGFLAIFLAGIMTSYTDISQRKIKNLHLVSCFVLGAGVFLFQGGCVFTMQHVLNTLLALAIAVIFYWFDLWRGGDAKLFVVFSFMMLATRYDDLLFYPCVSLLINSFLIGALIVFPIASVGVIQSLRFQHKQRFIEYLNYIGIVLVGSFSFSWMILPLLGKIGLLKYPVVACVFVYFGYGFFSRSLKPVLSKWSACSAVLLFAGWILRSWLKPESLRPEALLTTFRPVLLFSVVYFVLNSVVKDAAKVKIRFPFAPFLFMGCLLSYTGFLDVIMAFMAFLRR